MGWPSSSSSSTVASWALLSWTRWTRMVHLLLLEQNIRSSQEYHMPVSGTSVHIIEKAIHKQINDRDIAPVVVDLKFTVAEPREQPWAHVPVPLKREA